MLPAGFGLPCRGDKGMENKKTPHLYMHFLILKKLSLEEPHRLAGTPFGPPRTQEYLGQAVTSRNSVNDDVKSYSSSTQKPKKNPTPPVPRGRVRAARACPDKLVTVLSR